MWSHRSSAGCYIIILNKSMWKNITQYIKQSLKVYKPLLFASILLLAIGLVMFGSAALGVLDRNEVKFFAIIKSQFIYALLAGTIAMVLGLIINVKYYYKTAPFLYILCLILNAMVFIPGLNRFHGGAYRWLDIGNFSLQPSELLKVPMILITAWLMIRWHEEIKVKAYGLLYYIALILPVIILLYMQRDTGTMLILLFTSFIIYFAGGAKWRDIIILALLAVLGLVLIITFRPYAMGRIQVYLHPEMDQTGKGYQIRQSLLAIGQGGITGRGIGQGVQKFSGYLPEPISDSIYAVIGEEAGFVGSSFIIILYLYIIIIGLYIGKLLLNPYNKLLAIGIASLFGIQAYLNIGATIGVLPLTGVPLPLISHGGTSLLLFMFSLGILLNLSKYINKNKTILI